MRVVVEVNAHFCGNVLPLRFHQHLFTHDQAGVQCLPVHAGALALPQQLAHKKRVAAHQRLCKAWPDIAQNGAGHVFAHADIGHRHRTGRKDHAHGQAVDQQSWVRVHIEHVLQTQVDVKPRRPVLRARAQAKTKGAPTPA